MWVVGCVLVLVLVLVVNAVESPCEWLGRHVGDLVESPEDKRVH